MSLVSHLQMNPFSYTFTVEDRYGAPFEQLKPPDGYEFTGEFRRTKQHEWSLTLNGTAIYSADGESLLPNVILRPLHPRPKRKRIIFEETMKVPAGCFPMAGHEWYSIASHEGCIFKALLSCTFTEPATLYTRREEEF